MGFFGRCFFLLNKKVLFCFASLSVARQNDWDPLTGSTINHDSLPAARGELLTNGQHTATYTNRLQFE